MDSCRWLIEGATKLDPHGHWVKGASKLAAAPMILSEEYWKNTSLDCLFRKNFSKLFQGTNAPIKHVNGVLTIDGIYFCKQLEGQGVSAVPAASHPEGRETTGIPLRTSQGTAGRPGPETGLKQTRCLEGHFISAIGGIPEQAIQVPR